MVLKTGDVCASRIIPPGGAGLCGSYNLGRRGELVSGDADNRACDDARRSA